MEFPIRIQHCSIYYEIDYDIVGILWEKQTNERSMNSNDEYRKYLID